MLTIRNLTIEEMPAYRALSSICFSYHVPEADLAVKEMSPERLHEVYGAFDENNHLVGCMTQIAMDVRFEGHDARMLGIGGVVTDPADRRRGAIRQLFEEGLPRLYHEGYVFSTLYPFSHVFYRKFGYELGIIRRYTEVPVHAIRKDLRPAARIHRLLPTEPDCGMEEVYREYIRRKNMAVIRREGHWHDLRKGTPWENGKFTYVFFDADDKPMAYWTGTVAKEGESAKLTINDLAYTSRQGLESMFAMLATMNEWEAVRLQTPADTDTRFLVTDPYDISEHLRCGGMVRVMNVEKALALLPAPPVSGSFTVAVEDAQIPENCGLFRVESDGERLAVTRLAEGTADLKCGIGGLSVLVVGSMDFDDAIDAGMGELLTPDKRRLLALTFCRRKTHLHNYF